MSPDSRPGWLRRFNGFSDCSRAATRPVVVLHPVQSVLRTTGLPAPRFQHDVEEVRI